MRMTEYTEEEYLRKFRISECPNCRSRVVKTIERTKGDTRYTVYVCERCRLVIAREVK